MRRNRALQNEHHRGSAGSHAADEQRDRGVVQGLELALFRSMISTMRAVSRPLSLSAPTSRRDFTALEENLNYSQQALERVFSRYFGAGKRNAEEYARNPEKIANYVYMDEFRSKAGALGNVQPGDGWKFRGRGLKQLTGRNNYARFAKDYDMTADEAAEWIETKDGALASALWFWNTNNLNPVADGGDVRALTKRINGGDIGLDDRQHRYNVAMQALTGDIPPRAPISAATTSTLKRGSTGDAVKQMQQKLGIPADGDFGPGTEAAVKKWQAANGLTADGIVGPKTLAALMG
jgi:putative chitinase